MIDVGGPSMLRGGREELRARRAGLPARAVRGRARRAAASTASSRSRRGARSPRRRSRRPPRTRPRSRAGSRDASRSPRRSIARVRRRCSTSPTARTRTSAAAYYAERGARAPPALARRAAARQGAVVQQPPRPRPRARLLLREFALPACVIVKHANPCGVARRGDDRGGLRAGARLRSGVGLRRASCALNRPVSARRSATRLAEQFVEVLFAPGYDDERARGAAAEAGDRGSSSTASGAAVDRGERDYKRVLGGLLVQDRDWDVDDREGMEVVCGEPDEALLGRPALRLARLQARRARTRSCSRRTCRRSASAPARRAASTRCGSRSRRRASTATTSSGAVLASDAFFPFADGPQLALDAGVTAIIQPGGSKRDDEVVEAVRDGRRGDGVHRPPPLPPLALRDSRVAAVPIA